MNNLFYIIQGSSFNNSDNSVFYINSSNLGKLGLNISKGDFFSDNSHVFLDKGFARQYNKNVGDDLIVNNKKYIISGIFNGNIYFSQSIICPLDWDVLIKNNFSNYDEFNSFSSDIDGEVLFIGDFNSGVNKDQVKKDIECIDEN